MKKILIGLLTFSTLLAHATEDTTVFYCNVIPVSGDEANSTTIVLGYDTENNLRWNPLKIMSDGTGPVVFASSWIASHETSKLDQKHVAYVISTSDDESEEASVNSLLFNIPIDFTSREKFIGLMQPIANSHKVDLPITISTGEVYYIGCNSQKVKEL